MMLENFIVVLIGILVPLIIISLIWAIRSYKIRKILSRDKISFKESMDLVELPIVTFVNNGKKLNFLLDTGASYSSINESALKGLSYVETGETGFGMGIDGTIKEDSGYIRMNIDYRNQSYEDDFQVIDLSKAFGIIKQEYGINLHGILSNTFFQRYKYILDFDELVAYSKI